MFKKTILIAVCLLTCSGGNVSAQVRSLESKIDSLYTLGDSYRNTQPDRAIALFQQALILADSIDYTYGKIKTLDHLGVQYKKYGIFDESLRYHFKALSLLPEYDSSMTKAFILSNIGNTYSFLQRYDDAEDLYNQSLEIKKKLDNPKQVAYTLMKLGLVTSATGDYGRAINYAFEALEIEKSENDSAAISNVLSSIGFIEMQKRNYTESLKYLKNAQVIKMTFPDQIYGIAENYIWMAQNYIYLKQYSQAEKCLHSALDIAQTINSKILLLDSYYTYSQLYKKTKKNNLALKNLTIADSLNNHMKSDLVLNKIAQFSTVYSLELTEHENQLLKQQNLINELQIEQQTYLRNILIIIIVSAVLLILLMINSIKTKKKNTLEIEKQKSVLEKLNLQLQEANATKDKFFTIIAHDLKNPLGTLLGFGELIGNEFENLESEEKKVILKSIQSSSKKLSAMLENLLSWARSQQNQLQMQSVETDLSELIDSVIQDLKEMASLKEIKVQMNTNLDHEVKLDPSMIKVVLHNLLSNAIKFTHIGGEVKVNTIADNGNLIISVEDNGIGIPENSLEKLFRIDSKVSTPGTNLEVGTGLGLILCKEFIDKHGGKIEARNREEGGAVFTITLAV